jgi:membrane associated rhomboid family serine protease
VGTFNLHLLTCIFWECWLNRVLLFILANGDVAVFMVFLLAGVVATIRLFLNYKQLRIRLLGVGTVSAILFSSILLDPINKIYIMFIPIGIPAYVFGPAYLLYCVYMAKRNADNVAHDVHFWGALVGFLLPLLFMPELLENFISLIWNQ